MNFSAVFLQLQNKVSRRYARYLPEIVSVFSKIPSEDTFDVLLVSLPALLDPHSPAYSNLIDFFPWVSSPVQLRSKFSSSHRRIDLLTQRASLHYHVPGGTR